jgi:hypothetical protein
MRLLAIRCLQGVVGFHHDNRLIRGLFLVLDVGLFEDLVVDDPVVVDYSTLLAALVPQHAYNALLFRLFLPFLGLCLFTFAQERMQT